MTTDDKKEKLASGLFGPDPDSVQNCGHISHKGVPPVAEFEDDFITYIKRLSHKTAELA